MSLAEAGVIYSSKALLKLTTNHKRLNIKTIFRKYAHIYIFQNTKGIHTQGNILELNKYDYLAST